MLIHAIRLIIAVGLLGAATRLFIVPSPVPNHAIMLTWFALIFGIGCSLARWWALLLVPFPRLIALRYNLHTGQLAYLGESWQPLILFQIILGVFGLTFGIALGLGVRQWRTRNTGEVREE